MMGCDFSKHGVLSESEAKFGLKEDHDRRDEPYAALGTVVFLLLLSELFHLPILWETCMHAMG